MRRIVLGSFFVLTVIVGLATSGLADQVQLTFTGVNGSSQGGYYTSPYYGTITNKNGDKTNVELFCDDFLHEISIGETWTAYVHTFSDLSEVRFPGLTSSQTLQHYGEVAWLIEQMSQHPSQVGDIQFALWSINDPAVTSQGGFTAGSANWLSQAENRTYTPGMFWNFEILTPVNPSANSAQEMFVPRATPEPASLVLFGTGLLGIASYVRKRLK